MLFLQVLMDTVFLEFNTLIEKQFNTKIKYVQTDWGGEFRSLLPLLKRQGIVFRI